MARDNGGKPTSAGSSPRDERPRLLFVNRSYWPDGEATGQLLTELCEDLAPQYDAAVVAGQPNRNPSGASFQRYGCEQRHGVQIYRVPHTRFSKQSIIGRVLNGITFLLAATCTAMFARRPDVVIVESDPPMLCLLGRWLKWWHGTTLVVYLQDLHPDSALRLGKLPDAWWTRWLSRLSLDTYRQADRVLVVGRDMCRRLMDQGLPPERIRIVPNWTDTRSIAPEAMPATQDDDDRTAPFIVMYSGNFGLTQRLEVLLEAAERLAGQRHIYVVLVGAGVSRDELMALARRKRLENVSFLPPQPKERLSKSLGAAHVHYVPLNPLVDDCMLPSKLYSVLAAGRPVLAAAREQTELAETIVQHGVGVVVPPGDAEALAQAIVELAAQPATVAEMGQRAREVAVRYFDRGIATRRFAECIRALLPGAGEPATTLKLPGGTAGKEPPARRAA